MTLSVDIYDVYYSLSSYEKKYIADILIDEGYVKPLKSSKDLFGDHPHNTTQSILKKLLEDIWINKKSFSIENIDELRKFLEEKRIIF